MNMEDKMPETQTPSQFRELKFLLPSGEAVLYVPSKMKRSDFDILTTYLTAFKSATEMSEPEEKKDDEPSGE